MTVKDLKELLEGLKEDSVIYVPDFGYCDGKRHIRNLYAEFVERSDGESYIMYTDC